MKDSKILLPNRYRDKNYLVMCEENGLYKLELEHPNYGFRVIGNEGEPIEAVDPSGGPFLTCGYTLPNGYIVGAIVESLDGIRFALEVPNE